MSEMLYMEGTWRVGLDPTPVETDWFEYRATGAELWLVTLAGRRDESAADVVVMPPRVVQLEVGSRAPTATGLPAEAAALATGSPAVASTPAPVPRLSGNLAEDVHMVCGLKWSEIAKVFKISERAAAGWRAQGVPRHRQETMEALRAIGAILVGGLGPEGVGEWLTAGRLSRVERLRRGDTEGVTAEALSYLDSPAT
jgi:hypothetical protein